MANAKVPLKFQIFRGDEIIREEVLSEPVIKVGKLASSHLRLEDDSVSRMHAVVEVNGPDDVQLIDLGSTRGTLVNGERITKVRLHAGDEINFGDVRVIVAFLDQEEATVVAPHVSAAAAAQPQARPVAPPPAFTQPPPPAAAYAPPPNYPPPSYASAPPPFAGGGGYGGGGGGGAGFAMPGAANPVAAEVEVHDGARAIEVQALYRGVVVNTRHLHDPNVKATSNQAKGMLIGGIAAVVVAMGTFLFTVSDVGKEKLAYEAHLDAGGRSASSTGSPARPPRTPSCSWASAPVWPSSTWASSAAG